MLLPREQWRRRVERLRRAAETAAQERRLVRQFVGNAYDLEIDAQGRMLLNTWQRGFAGLEDGVVFIGAVEGVELTSEAAWASTPGEVRAEDLDRISELVYQRGGDAAPLF